MEPVRCLAICSGHELEIEFLPAMRFFLEESNSIHISAAPFEGQMLCLQI
jgi:hypothetical protein